MKLRALQSRWQIALVQSRAVAREAGLASSKDLIRITPGASMPHTQGEWLTSMSIYKADDSGPLGTSTQPKLAAGNMLSSSNDYIAAAFYIRDVHDWREHHEDTVVWINVRNAPITRNGRQSGMVPNVARCVRDVLTQS